MSLYLNDQGDVSDIAQNIMFISPGLDPCRRCRTMNQRMSWRVSSVAACSLLSTSPVWAADDSGTLIGQAGLWLGLQFNAMPYVFWSAGVLLLMGSLWGGVVAVRRRRARIIEAKRIALNRRFHSR